MVPVILIVACIVLCPALAIPLFRKIACFIFSPSCNPLPHNSQKNLFLKDLKSLYEGVFLVALSLNYEIPPDGYFNQGLIKESIVVFTHTGTDKLRFLQRLEMAKSFRT
jgi:hypothetical protein